MVGLPERHVEAAHQPIGQIGRGDEAPVGRRQHGLAVHLQIGDHAGHRRQRQLDGVGDLEGRRLVFLHVLAIGERQPLHHDKQADQMGR